MNVLLKIASLKKYQKIGIILITFEGESTKYDYFLLHRSKAKLDIEERHLSIDDFSPIKNISTTPNILCIQGHGLMHKLIEASSNAKECIPNLDFESFITETSIAHNNQKLLTLYRKEQFEQILQSSLFENIPVYGISTGLIPVFNYLQLLDSDEIDFQYANTKISGNNEDINIQKCKEENTEKIRFAGETYTNKEILALCTGLLFLSKQLTDYRSLLELSQQVKEHTAYSISKSLVRIGGPVLLILLLANYLLFDNYQNKLRKLEDKTSGIQQIQSEISRLEKELKQKSSFVLNKQIPDKFPFAFYIDRLSSYCTQGIIFKELAVCPIHGKIKSDEIITLKNNSLSVKGESQNSQEFSSFIEKLNNCQWIKRVSRQVYKFNNEKNIAEFELDLELDYAIE